MEEEHGVHNNALNPAREQRDFIIYGKINLKKKLKTAETKAKLTKQIITKEITILL